MLLVCFRNILIQAEKYNYENTFRCIFICIVKDETRLLHKNINSKKNNNKKTMFFFQIILSQHREIFNSVISINFSNRITMTDHFYRWFSSVV